MVVATLLSNSCLTGQPNPKKPTAVFSAVFWERFMSARFSYAPWGNQDDLNATFRDVQVGFSAPSQKFAYYGDGNLKLYSSLPVSNSEDGGTVKSEEANERVPMAEFPFSSEGDGTTRQYLLLFLKNTKANEPKYKVHALPFFYTHVCTSMWRRACFGILDLSFEPSSRHASMQKSRMYIHAHVIN